MYPLLPFPSAGTELRIPFVQPFVFNREVQRTQKLTVSLIDLFFLKKTSSQ